MPNSDPATDANDRDQYETPPTSAEVFDREADIVPVSQSPSTPRYGASGFGGQRSTENVEHFELKYPRQAIELDEDTRIIATRYNSIRDAWEVATSTPR